jgi:heme A synthase
MATLSNILIHAHSGFRWIVLILLILAIVKMVSGWKSLKEFKVADKKLALFAMIAYHTQFLLGLVLFFISGKVNFLEGFMKIKLIRFYTIEHSLMMIIAMVLITIGYSKAKKLQEDKRKFKTIAIFYIIALVIILAAIPWPFRAALDGHWS